MIISCITNNLQNNSFTILSFIFRYGCFELYDTRALDFRYRSATVLNIMLNLSLETDLLHFAMYTACACFRNSKSKFFVGSQNTLNENYSKVSKGFCSHYVPFIKSSKWFTDIKCETLKLTHQIRTIPTSQVPHDGHFIKIATTNYSRISVFYSVFSLLCCTILKIQIHAYH